MARAVRLSLRVWSEAAEAADFGELAIRRGKPLPGLFVFGDENAVLLDAERNDLLVGRASVALEHVTHVVPRPPK